MANFTTTADLQDRVLKKAGEVTNGNSSYESDALDYINDMHRSLIAGGVELETEINESWSWAFDPDPIVIELQPKHDTGTISVTEGDEAITFSSAPSQSLEGWHIKVNERDEWYRIIQHTAGQTSAELDSAYTDSTDSAANYKAVKLDYELRGEYVVINSRNKYIDFEETDGTELTATLTEGAYTPSELTTEIKTQMESAGGSTYTVTYDSVIRKFDIASDRSGGGGIFKLLLGSGSNAQISAAPILRFISEDKADAASHESDFPLWSVARLAEPLHIYKADQHDSIFSVDRNVFQRKYPFSTITEGMPTRYTRIRETEDGLITLRFSHYPDEKTRVVIPWIPTPRDLADNAASRPLVPRTFLQVIEYGAAGMILLDKEDDKFKQYINLARAKLKAMQEQYRDQLSSIGANFGATVARPEQLDRNRRRLRFGEPLND